MGICCSRNKPDDHIFLYSPKPILFEKKILKSSRILYLTCDNCSRKFYNFSNDYNSFNVLSNNSSWKIFCSGKQFNMIFEYERMRSKAGLKFSENSSVFIASLVPHYVIE